MQLEQFEVDAAWSVLDRDTLNCVHVIHRNLTAIAKVAAPGMRLEQFEVDPLFVVIDRSTMNGVLVINRNLIAYALVIQPDLQLIKGERLVKSARESCICFVLYEKLFPAEV